MSDTECDLEELTALLDEEDEGDNDEFKGDSVTFDNDDAKGPDKEINDRDEAGEASESDTDEECSFEQLSAILGQSDHEEVDEMEKERVHVVEKPIETEISRDDDNKDLKDVDISESGICEAVIGSETKKDRTDQAEDEFDEFFDSDMEEMVKGMENQTELKAVDQGDARISVNIKQKITVESVMSCKINSNKETHFKGSKRKPSYHNVDRKHEGEMKSDTETDNHSETEIKNQSQLKTGRQTEAEVGNQSDAEVQNLNNFEDEVEEMETESQKMEGSADSSELSKDDILAEMKMMSDRMKQLEAMLMQSKSAPIKSPVSMITKKKSASNTSQIKKTKPAIKTETLKPVSDKMSGKTQQKVNVNRKTLDESSVKREKQESYRKQIKLPVRSAKDEVNPFFEATSDDEVANTAVDPHSLFGDSDDSDWEGLDGEKKSSLSDEGRQIKKLLNNGPRQRVAHTPKYDSSVLKKSPPTRWTDHSTSAGHKPVKPNPIVNKPQLNPETGTVSGKYTLREEYKTKPAGPNLKDIDEKDVATDPYCGIKIINPRISMSEFKSKMSGRTLIKVSHIHQKVGRGDLQKDNWVTLGVVVHKTEPRQSASGKTFCIWKLSDLIDCDKTVSFFLFGNVYKEHWKNDLGTVIGLLNPSMMDKAEKVQAELAFTINHPQQLLIMGISKDLGRCKGTTKAGNPCSHFINKSQGEFCTYHVQAAYKKSSAKRTELQASTGITPKAFTNKGKKGSGAGCFFYGGQTFTTMKPQVKSTKDHVTLKKLQQAESNKGPMKVTTMSLHEIEPDSRGLKKLEEKDAGLLEKLMVPTSGSMNLVKHLVKKDKPQSIDTSKPNQPQIESVSAKDLLKQHQNTLKQRMEERKKLAITPTLGKGFSIGQDISLDVPVKKSKTKASAELAKSIAIAKLKEKGGVSKEDPNAVRKKLLSPEQKEKIRKRVAEDLEVDSKETDKESSEPPRKRSKFLGNVDLNDPKVQKLLKSKSKHKGALAEAEAEHEEKYFMALEKKEKMEEKMDSVMEVQVKLFKCKQCQYTAFSLSDRCKKENHVYKVVSGMKRFFKCKQCKKRTESIERFPTTPCKACGSTSFDRVSMLKERSGPKLESEELSLRGNEQKYLGSLNQKSYLNL